MDSPTNVGVSIIEAFESCLKPVRVKGMLLYTTYLCPARVLTFGWGSTKTDWPSLKPGDTFTSQQCDEIFADSLARIYVPHVEAMVRGRKAPLAWWQEDALISWTYNCGGPASSEVWKAVREGRDDCVPALLAQWNKGGGLILPGLVRRRKAEGLLYLGDISGALKVADATPPGVMPQLQSTSTDHERTTLELQRALNKLLGLGLTEDGVTGPATKAAVRKFQSAHALVQDGIAGGLTWTAIEAALRGLK